MTKGSAVFGLRLLTMERTAWLGLAAFFSCALSADGFVVLKNPGEKVSLPCGRDNFDKTLTWKHQDQVVVHVDTKSTVPRKVRGDLPQRARLRQTALEITGVKEADAGMFTCTVDGNSEQHFLFVVTVTARPSAVLQLGSSATLHCRVKGLPPPSAPQWRKPDGGLHPGSEVAQLGPVARADEGAWNCTFSHNGLTYGKSLEIRVTGAATTPAKPVPSEKDNKAPTCNDCVTSSPSLLLGLSWWMWALIAVGCLVLIVLTAFIIYLCKRIQRKKRKLQRMENRRQLLMPKQYCQCNRPTAVPKLQQRRQRQKPSPPPLQPVLAQ